MSSTSPDSEMGFGSEDSEIYNIAEVETKGIHESRLSISQTSSDDDQAHLYAEDPLANEEWTVEYQKEVDADFARFAFTKSNHRFLCRSVSSLQDDHRHKTVW